jgi:hypothetical protein
LSNIEVCSCAGKLIREHIAWLALSVNQLYLETC